MKMSKAMQQRESSIERRLHEMLRRRGALSMKLVSPGVPDRLVILPGGRIVFVELKQEQGTLSPLQLWQIDRLQSFGADVRVLWGKSQVQAFVEEVLPDEI